MSHEGTGPSKHWQRRRHRRKERRNERQRENAPSKLSQEEQERHKAEGLCYICHKAGHFSRNCPERQKVSSSSKPPGVSSFGVDVDFGDVENQRQLARSSECDPSVTLNFINPRGPVMHDEDDEIFEDLPDLESVWSEDDNSLGDSVTTDEDDHIAGMRIHVYNSDQFLRSGPTGTEIGTPLEDRVSTFMDTRFVVYNLHDGTHAIVESERDILGPSDRILIDTELLKRPAFRLDSWYWFRKGEQLGVPRTVLKRQDRERVWRSPPMGYPIEDAITSKLEIHALQFNVYDYQTSISLELPSSKTELSDRTTLQMNSPYNGTHLLLKISPERSRNP